ARELIQKARLAGVGQSDEADIGDEAQFEVVGLHVARRSLFEIFGRSIRGRAKLKIAATAHAAASAQKALAHLGDLAHESSVEIRDARAQWHFKDHIVAL